jgi:hypothetical protein
MPGLRLSPSRTGLCGSFSDTTEASRFPFRKFPSVLGVFDYADTVTLLAIGAVLRIAFPT